MYYAPKVSRTFGARFILVGTYVIASFALAFGPAQLFLTLFHILLGIINSAVVSIAYVAFVSPFGRVLVIPVLFGLLSGAFLDFKMILGLV